MIHSLAGGGAERLMAGLASRLAEHHRVTLLTLDQPNSLDYRLSPQVERRGLNLMRASHNRLQGLMRNLKRMRQLRSAILDSRPDVVLSFCDKTNILTLAAIRRTLPTVISEHSDPRQQRLGPVWQALRLATYRYAASAATLTEPIAAQLRVWTRGEVAVIPPAIDLPPLDSVASDRLIQPDAQFYWLCAGRLSPEKGFDRALRAFAIHRQTQPHSRLAIAGSGPEELSLKRLAAQLELHDHVEWLGWVQDMAPVYERCQGFLLTSRYEGFPLGLLEAMSRGLACVAMNIQSGPSEVITDHVTGRLVPDGDLDATAQAMQQITTDLPATQSMAIAAQSRARAFTWDAFQSRYEALLRHATETAEERPVKNGL